MARLADVVHELKSPMATLSAYVELTAEQAGEQWASASEHAQDGIARIHARLEEVSWLARAEAGLPDRPRQEVRVDELVDNLVGRYASDPAWGDVAFEADCRPALLLASADELERALRNLVENAAQHADTRVIVHVWGAPVVVEVEDDGPGVASTERDAIFTRYHTGRSGGTGLGLPIASAVVRAHGGALTLEDVEGGGARFVARFEAPQDSVASIQSGHEPSS